MAAEPAASAPPWLALPTELLQRHVLPRLSASDAAALRATNRLCRGLVNAATRACVLDVSDPAVEHAQQLPASFTGLRELRILASAAGDDGCASRRAGLEAQLPLLLRQLPCLVCLRYEGPADRRMPGLDLSGALQALAEAAAGHAAAAPGAADEPPGAGGSAAQDPAPARQQQLQELELRGGHVPDGLMASIGRLRLRVLKLSSTTAITTHLAAGLADHLTELELTVTPPLASSVLPLAALRHLSVLRMAALSPVRGWGAALAALAPCRLVELSLAFADVADADVATAAAALQGLTRLDLRYSRHLTHACVPHLASLQQLRELQLEQTGLQLTPGDMACLGAGCTQLSQLAAEFDLRAMPPPPPLPAAAAAAAAASLVGLVLAEGQPQLSSPGGGGGAVLVGRAALRQRFGQPQPQPAAPRCDVLWPPLRQLSVSGCSAANLTKLLAGCGGQLQALALEGLGPAPSGSEAVSELVGRAAGVTSLSLAGCSASCISSSAAAGLGGLAQLRTLSLADMRLPPSHLVGLLQAAAARGRLRSLALTRCLLADEVISLGLGALSSLRDLQLVACDGLRGAELLRLVTRLPHVRLKCEGCLGVGEGVTRAWECAAAAVAAAAAVGDPPGPIAVS